MVAASSAGAVSPAFHVLMFNFITVTPAGKPVSTLTYPFLAESEIPDSSIQPSQDRPTPRPRRFGAERDAVLAMPRHTAGLTVDTTRAPLIYTGIDRGTHDGADQVRCFHCFLPPSHDLPALQTPAGGTYDRATWLTIEHFTTWCG